MSLPTATVTFHTETAIAIENGFSVEDGAVFTAAVGSIPVSTT